MYLLFTQYVSHYIVIMISTITIIEIKSLSNIEFISDLIMKSSSLLRWYFIPLRYVNNNIICYLLFLRRIQQLLH